VTPKIALPMAAALGLLALLSPACGGKVVFEPEVVDVLGSCESFCAASGEAGCGVTDCADECDSFLGIAAGTCEPELVAVLDCFTAALESGGACEAVPTDCLGQATAYAMCAAQSSVSVGVGGG
jgi:hypothetical protein